jgi:glucosylceramidase
MRTRLLYIALVGLSAFPQAGNGDQLTAPVPRVVVSGVNDYWRDIVPAADGGEPTLTIDPSRDLQAWHGFGGTFAEAGWEVLQLLRDPERERAMRLLFDRSEGAGFTIGRIPIGASDYALDRYSLAPVPDDYAMEHFSIERDRRLLIPFVRAALDLNPDLVLWASPWSPPPWMKTNDAFDRGDIEQDARTLQAHALYLARFVESYRDEGIRIRAVHPQNEPGWPQDYPSCGWPDDSMRAYIANHLGPLFAERLPDTEVWLGTMSNTKSDSIVRDVMGDANAASYVRGIGLQWGMEQNARQYVDDYGLPTLQTEHRCGHYPWIVKDEPDNYPDGAAFGPAPNDHDYAVESWGLIKRWIDQRVNGYLAWNMVLDRNGYNLDEVRPWAQNALLVVDREARRLTVTPAYHVFRHVAGFVVPDATVLDVGEAEALAWRNPDDSIVAVVHNPGEQASETVLAIDGDRWRFSVPARGWATLVRED